MVLSADGQARAPSSFRSAFAPTGGPPEGPLGRRPLLAARLVWGRPIPSASPDQVRGRPRKSPRIVGDSGGFSATRSSAPGRSAVSRWEPPRSARASGGSSATTLSTRSEKSAADSSGGGGNDAGSRRDASTKYLSAAARFPS